MGCRTLSAVVSFVFSVAGALSQSNQPDPQPIYRVTVVSRTLPAINYEHRGGPTTIGFQGTVLLPQAKGHAIVESKRGRVMIDAKFEHIDRPTKYGREYLTYVLWAITPEGRPKNLGELVIDPSNKSKISVTTDFQAFGLMVTAEPYYAVTAPSDVVVLENVVRPETIGTVEPVNVKYELLPRGQYTMTLNASGFRTAEEKGEKVPYDRYEAQLELYQAQNAVQIARSMGADRFAPDSLSKAESLLSAAQDMNARKQDPHMIVSKAREAAQMAEDARVIAIKRRDEERLRQSDQSQARAAAEAQANAEARIEQERSEKEQAQAAAERAQTEAEQARALAAQRVAEVEAVRSRPAPPPVEAQTAPIQATTEQRQLRGQMLAQLNTLLSTRDTPRGLAATVPEPFFEGTDGRLRLPASERLARIAAIVASHPGMIVAVEGFTDDRGSEREDRELSQRRAQAVRDALVASGVNPASIRAIGYGKERPIASNMTASGREQNRRVEILISGRGIGEMALWDRGYSLTSRH